MENENFLFGLTVTQSDLSYLTAAGMMFAMLCLVMFIMYLDNRKK